MNGAPGEIRTPDRLVRSQVLYPAELRALLARQLSVKKTLHPFISAQNCPRSCCSFHICRHLGCEYLCKKRECAQLLAVARERPEEMNKSIIVAPVGGLQHCALLVALRKIHPLLV